MQVVLLLLSLIIGTSSFGDVVLAKQISQEEFYSAYARYNQYNQQLDTCITLAEKNRVRDVVINSLSTREREWLVTGDLEICSIGKYPATNEYYAQILWASEEQSLFLKPNMSLESPRIMGSLYGVYSSSGMYAGAKGLDCDNYAHIFIYETNKMGEKTLSGVYKNVGVICDEEEASSSPPPLFWYKKELYCRFRDIDTNLVVFYKIHIKSSL